jgi:hypothetical protein
MQIEVYGRYTDFWTAFFTDTEYSCFFFCVFSLELYAGLPIVLTIVHCDGTSILSLHTIYIRAALCGTAVGDS